MINIKELSIGNWIKISGTPVQILGIRTESQVYVLETEEADYAYAIDADIEPIEITPEILEKNGWRLGKYSSAILEIENKTVVLEFYESGTQLRAVDQDLQMLDIRISGVHQLQNALTLCGIDKEIKL